jgi:hypothetical protein
VPPKNESRGTARVALIAGTVTTITAVGIAASSDSDQAAEVDV